MYPLTVLLYLFVFSNPVAVLGGSYSAISGGSLILVGGGLDENNTNVWNKIIELGGGKGEARFGVIATASGDPCCGPDSSWVYYSRLLTAYGAASVVYIPITVDTKV